MRDSFVFYRSFAESVKNLPPEEYKKVMQSILDYALDGKEPEQSGIEYTVFCLVKPQIDANNKRYENGRKGGRPQEQNQTKTKANQNVTKVEPNNNQTITKPKPNNNQTVTTPEPNVYVNVNDNVNAKKKKDTSVSKEKASRFIPPTIEDIKAYCEEKGYKLDYDRFIDYYTSNGWMVGKNRMKDWRACVRNWARKDSSGCAEYPTKVSKFRNFQERSYDMDKLTRELLGG